MTLGQRRVSEKSLGGHDVIETTKDSHRVTAAAAAAMAIGLMGCQSGSGDSSPGRTGTGDTTGRATDRGASAPVVVQPPAVNLTPAIPGTAGPSASPETVAGDVAGQSPVAAPKPPRLGYGTAWMPTN